ncbi:MAG: DUF3108 domain-containing protein [Proteobacteria bacterium]|nr:DUF3108 domain-containing protein [Pseudomonadota bacterium]
MRFGLVALLAAFVATPAAADTFSLQYDGAALGIIPIGSISVDATIDENSYDVQTHMASGGLLSLFEHMNLAASASGEIDGDRVIWRRYDLDHHYARKHRVIEMNVEANGEVVAQINPTYRVWGTPPASDEQRRTARDPLSTMVAMAIDVGEHQRCEGSYPTFDGRFFYRLELSGGRTGHFDSAGYDGDVLKCSMAYVAVAGFEGTDSWGHRRIPRGEIWFALAPNSRFAPPVRVTTPLSAGGAVVRLTHWRRLIVDIQDTAMAEPTPAPTPAATAARP